MANTVRLIANAGVLIRFQGVSILIDVLHTQRTKKFSTPDYTLLRKVVTGREEFAKIDFLLVTHDHIDHNDDATLQQYIERHPETTVVTPTKASGQAVHTLAQDSQEFQFGKVSIKCRRLAHSGEKYQSFVNYGYLIEINGKTMLFLGDSMEDRQGIDALVAGAHINIAFLNFPLVTLSRGRKLVNEVIRPDEIVVFHLPFEQDDKEGYLNATRRTLEREKNNLPSCVMLYREDQTEEI
ncbi:MBL fold metallo-hydrolase [Christensenellaceae bacterium OttesenSCG-928-K19]|nr:MBL fold metallo-hydrolase [Christensenellaceae bacterium OttesenSCG-928-K19]